MPNSTSRILLQLSVSLLLLLLWFACESETHGVCLIPETDQRAKKCRGSLMLIRTACVMHVLFQVGYAMYGYGVISLV